MNKKCSDRFGRWLEDKRCEKMRRKQTADMIECKDFSFCYKGQEQNALNNINLVIRDGDFLGITGNSGAGKSTLTYAFSGIVPHHFPGDFYGAVKVNGRDTVDVQTEELARFVGEVFQDIDSQMVSSEVEDEILFGLENFGLPHDQIGQRLDEVLSMLKISDLRHRQISSLSGGQKQKVAIASILAMQPEIIVLDEPTGELDPQSTIMIYEILKQLNEEFGKTIIVVEQKIMILSQYAKRIAVLDEGKLVFDGKSNEIVDQQELFDSLGISVPRVVRLGNRLKCEGLYGGPIPTDVDQAETMVREVLGC
ncbi:MAG: ATP-binding cassette domain-containing protein [Clostridiales bacterium]|nr:ATP-binding cassette domain-containing protein [Clostridiales bacterium]